MIGGFTDPQGSRTGLGALLIGYYDEDGTLVYAGKVGTGFDRPCWPSCTTRAAPARTAAAAVRRGALPRSGRALDAARNSSARWASASGPRPGQLRHPRFLGLRRDKSRTR